MWKLAVILLVIVLVTFPLAPVLADTDVDITVTATPWITGGVEDFTITYVSETQLDFSWSYSGDATHIMIRGKYGSYPDNIPDEDTEPSDGYLVYYGTGTSASDTTMDFDQSPGAIYYAAWAQRDDGTWFLDTETGREESAILTLVALIVLCVGLSFVAHRSYFAPLRWFAGFAWIGLMIYWIQNPPSHITAGDAAHVAVMLVLVALGIAFMLLGLVGKGPAEGKGTPMSEEQERILARRTTAGNNIEYRAEVRHALGRDRKRRRR